MVGGFKTAAGYAAKHLHIEEELFYKTCLQIWRHEGNSGQIFNRVLQSLGLPETFLPPLVHAFRSQQPKLCLYPDAEQFLDTVQGKVRLGVVTDGIQWVQENKVRALHLSRYFNTIVYSDSFGRNNWKPSPVPYRAALKNLGSLPPEKAIYLGDNPYKDFSGAKKLGLYTLRLLRGQFRKVQVPPEQDAHAAFSSFKEITELVIVP